MQITGKISGNVQHQSFGLVFNNQDLFSKLGEYTFPQAYLMNHLGELSQMSDGLYKDVFIKVSENEDGNEIELKALVKDTNDKFKTRREFDKWDSSENSPTTVSTTIEKTFSTNAKKTSFTDYIEDIKTEIFKFKN